MKKTLLILAFFLVPLGLRFFRIGAAPLWYDEAFTAILARLPFRDMLSATMGDVHPPLWYFIAWLVGRLPLPIWAIRIPAALFSSAACWMFWMLLGMLQVPKRVLIAAYVVMVFSPFQLYFGQEARMYSLLTFLVITGAWALLSSRWTIFSFAVIGLLYTHNYGMFYVACLAGMALLLSWRNWSKLLVSLTCAGVAWIAWAGVVLWQMSAVNGSYWIQSPSLGSILYTLSSQLWMVTMPNQVSPVAIYATDSLMLIGLGYLFWKRPHGWAWVLLMASGPYVLGLLASWLYQPVFLPRSLGPTAPFLYLLICWPLASITWTRVRVLYVANFLAALIIIAFFAYYLRIEATKGGNEVIDYADRIVQEMQPGDLVCHTGDGSAVIVRAYFPELPNCKLISPHDASGSLTSITRQAIGEQEMSFDTLQYHRLWLFVAITPMMYPEELDFIDQVTTGMQVVKVFADDEFSWFGVYYADR
jgi:hypothetical protein